MKKVVVCGAGGFIGGHLVKALKAKGFQVRAVDIKPLNRWYQVTEDVDNLVLDLKDKANCYTALNGYNEMFNLAADMGGMGFIETHKAECMLSVLINTHLLMAAKDSGITRYFYASSACVYNGDMQKDTDNPGDIGIIGYGFSETAQLFSPSLTIINQDPRKMGLIAVNTLIDEILEEEKPEPLSIVIDEDFQWKTSVLAKP